LLHPRARIRSGRYHRRMSDESPDPADDETTTRVSDVRPLLIRRHQAGPLWKAVVRVMGGVMSAMALGGYLGSLIRMPTDAWVAILICAGAAAGIGLVAWERGMVLKHPIWEGSKDLRAQSYRGSASRFDSSGVRVVDPHSGRNSE
jgi:hypothetical protein